MTFAETLGQVRELLQSKQRVSYRALKRQFALDDDYLEDLKAELIDAERVAADEDGKVLVWTGTGSPESRVQSLESEGQGQTPIVQPLDYRRQTLDAAAERRQLTVLFCDLVGSTALSTELDPEEYRAVVRAYQQVSAEVIGRYDGHIAQHLGDGLLVYFGYPVAHEDDAARAVRAGLEIITALHSHVPSPLAREGQGEGKEKKALQVRIGIHTGLVVIGEIGSSEKREVLALGETPNLAARIQGTANPDEVRISAATYHLVEGLFEFADRGQPNLKGIATPLTLYRAVRESEAHSRFEVVVRKGLTPLVGRDHEYGLLHERWQHVKDGAGQVVLLSGEPGIGKSRLVEALKETVEHEGARCLELRCSPYTQNSALAPVIEHVQRVLQFRPDDAPEDKLRKLEYALKRQDGANGLSENPKVQVIASAAKQSLPETGITSAPPAPRNDTTRLQEMVPLFTALLSLPHPEGYPSLTMSPQKQKEKTYEALVAWLCTEARQQAVTYAWEDLHWADPSTLELLTLLLAQVPTTRLLAVLTFRPEFIPPWGAHSYLSQLTLNRLGQSHVGVMVEKVTGGKALPNEVVRQIASKTDGVPLFVEELTKMVLESDLVREVNGHYELSGPLPPLAIPSTLQDSLMARLDRLATVREIAQIGATLGREFNYELLTAVSPLPEDTLQQGLKQLVEAELVFQSGILPQARYLFKHALVQDTAYQSLLKSRRQQLHQQVAQVLVEQFPQTVETQPELVAHHYTEASLIEQALPYWQQAGERANQRSAYVEAISHLTKGLEVLKTLPDTLERVQQELTLQLALSDALAAVKGFAAPEVGKAATWARELCQQLGETPQLSLMLYRLSLFYMIRGEVQTAHELAKQMLRLAQSLQEQHLLAQAHTRLGWTLYDLGELTSARPHLEEAIALCDPQQHPRRTVKTYYPRVECLSYTAWTLWHLGYPDQGLQRSREAVALAERLSHPFLLAYALGVAAWFHSLRREELLTRERAEAAITLSTEQGFPFWLAVGMVVRGGALAEQGQVEEGIAQMQQGLAALRAMGAEEGLTRSLAKLAEAHAAGGQVEKGLRVLTEALDVVDKEGERFYEAELYRLKGELTLQKLSVISSQLSVPNTQHPTPNTQEAEACFLKAMGIAQSQKAKSWELCAATSLARLWQQQGKQKEAHQMLSEIYNWFTEGFDTKDLQEAKTLLEELLAT